MAFGVSPSICLGRYFASSKILALVAMIALRHGIAPADQVWHAPTRMNSATTPSMGDQLKESSPRLRKRDESTKGSRGSPDSLKANGNLLWLWVKTWCTEVNSMGQVLHTEPIFRCV
jgi:hypothetical protein